MSAITDELTRAAYLAVVIVIVFLGLRWGLPDTALHRGAAIMFMFLAGAVFALLMLSAWLGF